MLARYLGSIVAGAVVTAVLIYWMQLLIDNEPAVVPAHKRALVFAPSPPAPPQPRTRRPVPQLPLTQHVPPDSSATPLDPPTARNDFVGPDTPPGPSGPPDHPGGRTGPQGPWAADSELLLVASVRPSYPYAALRRELEGYVVVEFSVTRTGEVTDARVIESSDQVFDQAALDSVEKSRFRPRIVAGAPSQVTGLRRQVVFTLDH